MRQVKRLLPLALLAAAAACSPTATADALDLAAVRSALVAEGVRLGTETTEQRPVWGVPVTTLSLPDARSTRAALQVNVYQTSAAASADLTPQKMAMSSFPAPPHFYQAHNVVLILFAGPSDASLIEHVEASVRRLGGRKLTIDG